MYGKISEFCLKTFFVTRNDQIEEGHAFYYIIRMSNFEKVSRCFFLERKERKGRIFSLLNM